MNLEQEMKGFQKSDVIIMCGLPGAGKSHFAIKHLIDSDYQRIVVQFSLVY